MGKYSPSIHLVRTGITTMRGDYRNLLGLRRPD
jgi:hypothetical protein